MLQHQDPDTIKYRLNYIAILEKLEKRMRMWVEVEPAEEKRLRKLKPDYFPAGKLLEESGKYLHHQDDWDDFINYEKRTHPDGGVGDKPAEADWKCDWGHKYDVCKCHCVLNHNGQDESIYKAFQLTSRTWTLDGVRGLRKKGDGPGEMISAYTDDFLGFGLPLTPDQLLSLNAWRQRKHGAEVVELKRSPGLRFLKHGKNNEGWWGYDDLSGQCDDVFDLYDWLGEEVVKEQQQQLGEYDWSSGHSKAQEGGLNANAFGKNVGGKQTIVRDTLLEWDGCVGNEPATLYTSADGKTWSLLPIEGGVEVDCRVRKGDVHSAVFKLGDPPPFKDLKRPETGVFREEIIKKRRPRNKPAFEEVIIKEHKGYVGEAKGSDQYLWERGLYFDKRETPNGSMAPMVFRLDKCDPKERTEEWSQVWLLSNLTDFEKEQSALEKKYLDRGDIPLFCAKGHPELAGKGVEFCWGVSKRNFRKINNSVGKHLHANMLK
jgi:hypothetical protein